MSIETNRDDILVSILINNYNYASFIRQAIDSSLAQSYSNVEVVVVDDGSADDSAEIIRSYGDRIVPVIKANGGQASAMNAGFSASRGEIIVFLDADDYFHPHAVETIVSAWKPGTVQAQSRLDLVDAQGGFIDLHPAPEVAFDAGDVKPLLLSKGRYNTTVTTGTSFSRSVLEKILPIPEPEFRISADGYLVTIAPFYGDVLAIDVSIGARRQHGNNLWASPESGVGPDQFRKSFQHDFLRYKYLKETADKLGYSVASNLEFRDYLHVQDRLAALRLDPQNYPVKSESRILLAGQGFWSIWKYSSYSSARKLVLSLWFIWTGIAPQSMAARAIAWKFTGKSRPKWADYVLKKVRFATR